MKSPKKTNGDGANRDDHVGFAVRQSAELKMVAHDDAKKRVRRSVGIFAFHGVKISRG